MCFTRVGAGSSKLAFSRAECDKCQFFSFLDILCRLLRRACREFAADVNSVLRKQRSRIRALAKKIKTPHLTT